MDTQEFYEYVNMTSNSVFMRALHYYDIKYTPDMNELIEANKLGMTIGMPDKGNNPENPSGIVMKEIFRSYMTQNVAEVLETFYIEQYIKEGFRLTNLKKCPLDKRCESLT